MCIPNLDEITQSTVERKIIPVLETDGRHIEILSLVSILTHVNLHQPAKFCSNPTTGGGVMTSYRFFKMAAIKSEIYFRFQVS